MQSFTFYKIDVHSIKPGYKNKHMKIIDHIEWFSICLFNNRIFHLEYCYVAFIVLCKLHVNNSNTLLIIL